MIVSIQQAANNALVAYLAPLLSDVDVTSNWPSPDRELPEKAITVLTAGARRDQPLDPKQLKNTISGLTQVNTIWQVASCIQPFQIDIWTHSVIERDDLVARLDILLHAGASALGTIVNQDPVGNSLLLPVLDGWEASNTTADFEFDHYDDDDSSDSSGRNIYRSTFRGDGNFMLTITKTSARQKQINLSMFLDGDTTATTYST
jgi:hypothetical protein